MSKSLVNILSKRLEKKKETPSKMAEMAHQTVHGHLTSFSGIFNITDLTLQEKGKLETLLKEYSQGDENIDADLKTLTGLTSEVKAINNQAAILHGERIKKAHTLLVKYRDGAFTAWLMAAYGNRQTPYNFMQYYEFHEKLPKHLRPKLETMPRQAVYSLASREGEALAKTEIVEQYNGETKTQLLEKIREVFPLETTDKRARSSIDNSIAALARIAEHLQRKKIQLTKTQKQTINSLLDEIRTKVNL